MTLEAETRSPDDWDSPPTSFSGQWESLKQCLGTNSLYPEQIRQVSPTALAYVGDAVYELFFRVYFLLPAKRSQAYHHQVVAQVRAEQQAEHFRSLTPYLTPQELDIVRRARNVVNHTPKRLDPKTYQQATSLEALIGYLYLTDVQRLTQLLEQLRSVISPPQ